MKTKSICPSCNVVLEFDRAVHSVVKCPKCSHKGNVTEFEESIPTEPSFFQVYKPGKLELVESDTLWLQDDKKVILKRGVNTLGRMSPNSTSNIQLPVNDSFMSRNHASIDVVMTTNGVFEHRLSDLGSQNGTYYNGIPLEKGDIIRLTLGDIIKVGHTHLRFVAE